MIGFWELLHDENGRPDVILRCRVLEIISIKILPRMVSPLVIELLYG
jgi:hypothetical protein